VPASSSQRRLWFLHQLEPSNPAYNIAAAVRLRGAVDLSAMGRALNEVVRRHQALRTTFAVDADGLPVQVIAEDVTLPLPVADLAALPEARRELEVSARLREEAARPFDLAVGPLIRAELLRLAPAEHVIVLNMHHVDRRRDLDGRPDPRAGGALRIPGAGRPLTAARAAPPVRRLRPLAGGMAAGRRPRGQLDYWRRSSTACRSSSCPPTGRGGRPEPPGRVALADPPRAAGPEPATAGAGRGGDPLHDPAGGFQALLHRYTGQEDIAVGTPIAGRARPEFAAMIGLFVNTLVLRTDLAGGPDFRELLGRVRRTAMDAYAHQDVPFEQARRGGPARARRGPIAALPGDVRLPGGPAPRAADAGLSIVPLEIDSVAAKFDLTLFASETDQGLRLKLEYDADLFDAATIDRMLGHYRTLLEGALADPSRPVAALPMLAESERRQLLREWNATRAEYPRDVPAHRLFEAQVARTPEAVALSLNDRTLSYRELDAGANRLARHLRGLGVGPESRVGLCLERSPELVVGLLAVLKAGGAVRAARPGLPRRTAGLHAGRLRAEVLLTRQRCGTGSRSFRAGRLPGRGRGGDRRAAGDRPDGGAGPDHLAYIIYTSAPPGVPRGR
jgi:hypothetical protein